MMNAERVGPAKMAAAFNKPDVAPLMLMGRRPAPSSPSTHGVHTSHERA